MSQCPAASNADPSAGTVALSIIAPCFNEEGNVEHLARRTLATLEEMGIAGELVLVDDGSSDATWQRMTDCSARDARVRPIRHEENHGMEAAWRTGLAHARGELVCLIDADLQNRPEDIASLHATFTRGEHDVVQAIRHSVAGGGRMYFFTRGLNLLLNLLFRTRLRDNKSGFLLCRRSVLARILYHRYRYRYFQALVGASAAMRGYRIGEVDTVFEARHYGRSFLGMFPVFVSARIVWELLKFRLECSIASPARPAPESGLPAVEAVDPAR